MALTHWLCFMVPALRTISLEGQEKILWRWVGKVMVTAWHASDEILGCERHEWWEAPLLGYKRTPANPSRRARECRDRGRECSWHYQVLYSDPFPCQSQEAECMEWSQGWDEVSIGDRLIVPEPTYNDCLRLLRDYWHCYFCNLWG